MNDTQAGQKGETMKSNKRNFKLLSLEELVLKRLYEISSPLAIRHLIDFPTVFSRICPLFCLTKEDAWVILRHLKKKGRIEIVPFKGIKLVVIKDKN